MISMLIGLVFLVGVSTAIMSGFRIAGLIYSRSIAGRSSVLSRIGILAACIAAWIGIVSVLIALTLSAIYGISRFFI